MQCFMIVESEKTNVDHRMAAPFLHDLHLSRCTGKKCSVTRFFQDTFTLFLLFLIYFMRVQNIITLTSIQLVSMRHEHNRSLCP